MVAKRILKITKGLLWPCAMMTRRLSAHLPIGMKCQENMVDGPLIGFLFVPKNTGGIRLVLEQIGERGLQRGEGTGLFSDLSHERGSGAV